MQVLMEYEDGVSITRSRGKFDDWCIYVDNTAPYDRDYLSQIKDLADRYGTQKVYHDFKRLYDITTEEIERQVFDQTIPEIAATYGEDSLEVEKLFGVLYSVMLAEENRYFGRTKTKLGRQVKGLAVYQILFEGYEISDACNYSKGKGWRELASECEEKGLQR